MAVKTRWTMLAMLFAMLAVLMAVAGVAWAQQGSEGKAAPDTSGQLSQNAKPDGSLRASELQTTDECSANSDICTPSGFVQFVFNETNPSAPCTFNQTVAWGDGTVEQMPNIQHGQTFSHQYANAGVYKVRMTGNASSSDPNTTCTYNPATFVVEFPTLTEAQELLVGRVTKRATPMDSFWNSIKELYGKIKAAETKQRKQKLQRQQEELIRKSAELAKKAAEAKEAQRWKKLDLPTTRGDAGAKLRQGQLLKVWNFLEDLLKLKNYDQVIVQKANQYYKTSEGRNTLDSLANLNYGKDYSRLSDNEKRNVASQAQRQSGAFKILVERASEAGKSATRVTFGR